MIILLQVCKGLSLKQVQSFSLQNKVQPSLRTIGSMSGQNFLVQNTDNTFDLLHSNGSIWLSFPKSKYFQCGLASQTIGICQRQGEQVVVRRFNTDGVLETMCTVRAGKRQVTVRKGGQIVLEGQSGLEVVEPDCSHSTAIALPRESVFALMLDKTVVYGEEQLRVYHGNLTLECPVFAPLTRLIANPAYQSEFLASAPGDRIYIYEIKEKCRVRKLTRLPILAQALATKDCLVTCQDKTCLRVGLQSEKYGTHRFQGRVSVSKQFSTIMFLECATSAAGQICHLWKDVPDNAKAEQSWWSKVPWPVLVALVLVFFKTRKAKSARGN